MELFGAVYCVLLFLSSHTQGSNVELVEKASKFERRDVDTCLDNSLCATLPDICTNLDQALVKSLCPAKCGLCPTQGTCTPSYCQHNGVCLLVVGKPICGCPSEYTGAHCEIATTTSMPTTIQPTTQAATTATTIAATTTTATTTTAAATTSAATTTTPSKAPDACSNNPCLNGGTCLPQAGGSYSCQCPSGFAGTFCLPAAATPPPSACAASPCINGATCMALAGDTFKCMCPAGTMLPYCLPPAAATSPSPVGTQAPSSVCDTSIFDGCEKAEVVFMIEYSRHENHDIDHEGDYVRELIDKFRVDSDHVRVGVVVYHDTVAESIHITDYAGDKSGLKNRVKQLTDDRHDGELHPSGEPDLAKALEFVKQNSFKGARPGAKKVVIPIIHWVDPSGYTAAVQAASQLKTDCVQIFAQAVQRPYGESGDIVKSIATSPNSPYYTFYHSFNDLENGANHSQFGCSN